MNIRNATYKDAPAIKSLLEALGYTTSISLLVDQLEIQFGKDDHQVFVCELKKEVVGFAAVHFMPQLAFGGGLMVISHFSVDETVKHIGVDKELEQYITDQARLRKCERIQVNGSEWPTPAHQFYVQQGYQEYPKYFTKKLL